jgi:predicted metal-dependent enzyme (double-stranded beta helix superfamily)
MITALPSLPPAVRPRTAADVPARPTPADTLSRLLRYGTSWATQVRYDPDRRWYSRVGEHDGHEVWLLSWLPGQATELHDHGRARGAFAVVSGTLTELSVRGHRAPSTEWVRWGAGEVRRFGAAHVHQIRNDAAAPAVSLHAYAPALATMTRYALRPEGLVVLGVDRAGSSW